MVASSVPPRPGAASLAESARRAGVRFVYFSPRNMRRSKALAEKVGREPGVLFFDARERRARRALLLRECALFPRM